MKKKKIENKKNTKEYMNRNEFNELNHRLRKLEIKAKFLKGELPIKVEPLKIWLKYRPKIKITHFLFDSDFVKDNYYSIENIRFIDNYQMIYLKKGSFDWGNLDNELIKVRFDRHYESFKLQQSIINDLKLVKGEKHNLYYMLFPIPMDSNVSDILISEQKNIYPVFFN